MHRFKPCLVMAAAAVDCPASWASAHVDQTSSRMALATARFTDAL